MSKITGTVLQFIWPPETDSTLYVMMLLVATLPNSYNALIVPQNVGDHSKGHLCALLSTPFPHSQLLIPPTAVGKLWPAQRALPTGALAPCETGAEMQSFAFGGGTGGDLRAGLALEMQVHGVKAGNPMGKGWESWLCPMIRVTCAWSSKDIHRGGLQACSHSCASKARMLFFFFLLSQLKKGIGPCFSCVVFKSFSERLLLVVLWLFSTRENGQVTSNACIVWKNKKATF